MVKKYIYIFLLLKLCSLIKINHINQYFNKNEIRTLEQESEELSEDIIIIHTNDVHCGLNDSIGYDGLILYKKELQTKYKYVLTVDAGDHIQGGAIGILSKGLDIIDIMNDIEYDVVALGNHEFDYGLNELYQCSKNLKTGYISANFCYRKNKTTIFPPYKIIDVGSKKIGFIGVTTPQTLSKTYLHNIVDEQGKMVYDFLTENKGKELYDTIQSYIDEIRKNVDYIIILSHLGNDGDALDEYTSTSLLSNINGVDAMIDGHTHKVYNTTEKDKDGKKIPLVQTGTKLTHLGILKLTKNGIISEMLSEIPKPENVQYDSIYRDKKVRFIDSEMSNIINDIFNSHYDELNWKIGYTSFDLKINIDNSGDSSKQISRSEESTLCDLAADAIRHIGKGDICMINAGSVRTDLMKGDITFRHILDILPFSADIIIKEVSGQDILDALEFGMKDLPKKTSRFPQVSGISFKVNTSIKSTVVVDEEEMFVRVEGKRRVYDVFVGKEKIDINKKYRLSFDNYIGNGGDGFSMFNKYEELLSVLKTDNEALKIYIEDELKGIIPDYYKKTQGRIIIHSESFFMKLSKIIPIILLYIILLYIILV